MFGHAEISYPAHDSHKIEDLREAGAGADDVWTKSVRSQGTPAEFLHSAALTFGSYLKELVLASLCHLISHKITHRGCEHLKVVVCSHRTKPFGAAKPKPSCPRCFHNSRSAEPAPSPADWMVYFYHSRCNRLSKLQVCNWGGGGGGGGRGGGHLWTNLQ